jgi:hypothetical protein
MPRLSFHNPETETFLSQPVACAIAMQRAERAGLDPAEVRAYISRLEYDEEAREVFEEISGLEVFSH